MESQNVPFAKALYPSETPLICRMTVLQSLTPVCSLSYNLSSEIRGAECQNELAKVLGRVGRVETIALEVALLLSSFSRLSPIDKFLVTVDPPASRFSLLTVSVMV